MRCDNYRPKPFSVRGRRAGEATQARAAGGEAALHVTRTKMQPKRSRDAERDR